MRHFLDLFDVSPGELRWLMTRALELKAARARREAVATLAGRTVAMVFEKPSLRTRVSFDAAVAQLGGTCLFLPVADVGLGWREPLADFARTLNHYVDALVLRVKSHETLTGLARYSNIPIVNALSDQEHPCQAVADLLTMTEKFGDLEGRTLVFVGDGNNVARSAAVCAGKLGVRFVLSAPAGYEFPNEFVERFRRGVPGGVLEQIRDPRAAVRGADAVYTDVWTSMGQESERDARLRDLAGYQVDDKLMSLASPQALFLHCLPARRGEEVAEHVLEGPQSAVFEQAGNRMHGQKAILEWLLGVDR